MKFSNGLKRAGVMLALSFVIMQASAQKDSTAYSPEARAKNITDKMKTELTLSDDQYNKVYDINLKYAQKNTEALKEEGTRLAKLKAVKAENEEKNKELKGVLTEEQFEKYKGMRKEMKSGMKQVYKKRKTDSVN
ncbi:MAG TPA: hypothetical protein VHN59_06025 [Chitinophagaceae bacterium]|nr:hypothetical protein [Chitinophagaceae bacterium]